MALYPPLQFRHLVSHICLETKEGKAGLQRRKTRRCATRTSAARPLAAAMSDGVVWARGDSCRVASEAASRLPVLRLQTCFS